MVGEDLEIVVFGATARSLVFGGAGKGGGFDEC